MSRPRITDAAWDLLPDPVADALDPGSDLTGTLFRNEHGDWEQIQPDGRLTVVVLSSEGIICDWFRDGEPDDTWCATWDDLSDEG